jgi:AAA+ superfamily predicted ATPase
MIAMLLTPGKTTAAKLMGRAFDALGVLASGEVVAMSAAKLQGEFVGQTAPRVRNAFRSALGKVLFIGT